MLALKEKLTGCGRFLLLACALVGTCADTAHAGAEGRVLLLEAPEEPSGLLTALQIQLSGLAEPQSVPQPRAASAPQQIEAASRLTRDQGALAAVWVDPPLDRASGAVMLYVVGEREGRALVEVVRVPGDRGPELERTLALKVREVVAELQRAAAAAPVAAQLLPAEPIAPEPEPELPEASWQPLLALGMKLGSQPGLGLARWGLTAGAGPSLASRDLRLSGVLYGDWFPPRDVDRLGDHVRYWELGATLLAHAQLRLPGLWLGASLGPRLLWLQAEGRTVLEASGSAYSNAIWGVAFGVDAEWPLTAYLGLAADLQIEGLSVREHLRVNEQQVVDVGRFRARLGISLVLHPGS